MKSKFRLNPNTVLIMCILGMTFLASIIMAVVNVQTSSQNVITAYRQLVWPVSVIEFIAAALILFMAYQIFKMVKRVINNERWDEKYYRNIKRIGWLSVLVLLLGSFSGILRSQINYRATAVADQLSTPVFYINALVDTLFNSPIAWLLVLCIFLLADVLNYAIELRSDNESII